MLQQTRAETVIPYFLRWMELFPTIEALGLAMDEKVMKAWEGLGYYSRARSLHKTAILLSQRKIPFPDSLEALLQLPGIGPYTAGAILSFAFKKRAFAIDGNVARVLSRLYAIEAPIDSKEGQREIEEKIDQFLPQEESFIAMEAMIELGALVCTKRPECSACPLQDGCMARKEGKEGLLPIKKKGPPLVKKERTVLVIEQGEAYLLRQGGVGEIMEGLYEFPYFEEAIDPTEGLLQLGFGDEEVVALPKESHSFTRYIVVLFPYYVEIRRETHQEAPSGYRWVEKRKVEELPFSSGHRRILSRLMELEKELSSISVDYTQTN
jgi:A/G-specific adenine glycosylase